MATDILNILVRERGGKAVEARLTAVGVAGTGAERSVRLLNRSLGILATSAVLRGLSGYVDSFTRIQNAIKIAGVETDRTAEATQRLLNISNQTRTALEENALLFAKLGQTQAELGVSTEKLFRFTQLVGKGFAVQATNAQGVRGATIQLSQAMGEGIVRAQEFNSLIENNRPLLLAAAAGIEEAAGSVSKLRIIMKSAELTSARFFRGVIDGGNVLDELFARTTPTIGQAFLVLNNNITTFLGRMDQAVGASATLAQAIIDIGGSLETLIPGFILAGTILVSRFVGPAIAGFTAAGIAAVDYQVKVQRGIVVTIGSAEAEIQRTAALAASAEASLIAVNAEGRQLLVKRSVLQGNIALIETELALAATIISGNNVRNVSTGQFIKASVAVKLQRELKRELIVTNAQLTATERALTAAQGAEAVSSGAATAAQGAHAAAIARTGFVARAATAALALFNRALAFLGGPVGAAIVALSVGMLLFANKTARADKLLRQLENTVTDIRQAFEEANGELDIMVKKLKDITLAQAILQAEKLKNELDDAATVLASRLGALSFRPEVSQELRIELLAITNELFTGERNFEAIRDKLNEITKTHPGLVQLLSDLGQMTNKALKLTDGVARANAVINLFSDDAAVAAKALRDLGIASDDTSQSIGNLGDAAAISSDSLRKLIDFIPRLKEQAEISEDLFIANNLRTRALKDLTKEQETHNLSTLDVIGRTEQINAVYREAVAEIDLTAKAQRKLTSDFDDYVSDSRTAGLTGRSRAIEAETRKFEELAADIRMTTDDTDLLNKANDVHVANLARINKQFDEQEARSNQYRNSLKTLEGFTADFNRKIEEEIMLLQLSGRELAVQERVFRVIQTARQKDIILTREQIDAIREQFEVVQDFREVATIIDSARETVEAYGAAWRGATAAMALGEITAERLLAVIGNTDVVANLRELDQALFGAFGEGLEAQIDQFRIAEAEKLVIVQEAVAARILTEQMAAERVAQIHAQTSAKITEATLNQYQVIASQAAVTFDSMAAVVEQSLGRQSAAFKVLFVATKAAALASAIVNTATGVTQALAASPPPLNFIMAGLVAAAGGVQIGTIIAQTIQGFLQGGLVGNERKVLESPSGRISGSGTTRSDSILARLSNQEFVVNAKATSQNINLLQAINEGRRLQQFANGGRISDRKAGAPIVVGSTQESSVTRVFNITVNTKGGRTREEDRRSGAQIGKAFAAALSDAESRAGE